MRGLWTALALMAVAPSAGWSQNHVPIRLDSLSTRDHSIDYIPFGPGERLYYKVKVGLFSVGEGTMTIGPVEEVHGHPTYFAEWHIKGGVPFWSMDSYFRTWMDTETLVSRRFVKDQHEGGRKRYREFEFFPEERRWHRIDHDTTGTLPSELPLDDISFVYFARTLPLEVGDRYTFNRFYKDEGNPVVIEVVRKDEREVGAGKFRTIVVRPTIRAGGLFGEGGEAEIHFSDDDRRLIVYMKSRLPGMSLTLHLEGIEEGTRLERGGLTAGGGGGRRPGGGS
ncbi:MAG: DUF3108 domain-containing protein [Gemmatimonadota bacterium]|nr:DUF3108 domain-containing protein [Gemmatimonadota bacterium]